MQFLNPTTAKAPRQNKRAAETTHCEAEEKEEDILYFGMGKNLPGIAGGEGEAHSVVRNDQEPAHKVERGGGVGGDYVLCNLGQGLQEIIVIFLEWAKRICPHEIM